MPAHRLLLAEADPACRAFLADNLTADGYAVTAVDDDRAAIAHLYLGETDVVVADVNGTTLGLVDWIRNRDEATDHGCPEDVPVVVLRTHSDELERVRLLERGADDVIAKPFGYPELRARVARILSRTAPRRPRTVTTAGPAAHRSQHPGGHRRRPPGRALRHRIPAAV